MLNYHIIYIGKSTLNRTSMGIKNNNVRFPLYETRVGMIEED